MMARFLGEHAARRWAAARIDAIADVLGHRRRGGERLVRAEHDLVEVEQPLLVGRAVQRTLRQERWLELAEHRADIGAAALLVALTP
jgi:hypothetical protein